MSMPISSIALMASGLMWVASVPALITSKRSPASCLSSPSAIWLLAELWVQRNRILLLCGTSAAATGHATLLGTGEQAVSGLTKQLTGGLPVEGVEAPLPAPLLAHQPCVLELLHVVGDLGLAHTKLALELADADALISLACGHVGGGEIAATPAIGHHGEHPYPDRIGEGAAQGYEPLHPFLGVVLGDAILLHDPEFPGAHEAPPDGLRPRMKALASGTSAAAVVAASPQQPDPPQHPEASANSCLLECATTTETSSKPASCSSASYSSF